MFNGTNNHQVRRLDENYVYIGMPGYDPWEADENLDPYGNPRFNPDLSF